MDPSFELPAPTWPTRPSLIRSLSALGLILHTLLLHGRSYVCQAPSATVACTLGPDAVEAPGDAAFEAVIDKHRSVHRPAAAILSQGHRPGCAQPRRPGMGRPRAHDSPRKRQVFVATLLLDTGCANGTTWTQETARTGKHVLATEVDGGRRRAPPTNLTFPANDGGQNADVATVVTRGCSRRCRGSGRCALALLDPDR